MDRSIAGQLMNDLQRDFGLTRDQAAGVVGNLAHESGGFKSLQEISPMVPGSKGGYGYAQWTGPRRNSFEDYVAKNNLDPTSYAANYGFLSHEFRNDPYESKQFSKVMSTRTPEQAAQVFSQSFLRPGIPHMQSRINYAKQLAQMPPTVFEEEVITPPVQNPPAMTVFNPDVKEQNAMPSLFTPEVDPVVAAMDDIKEAKAKQNEGKKNVGATIFGGAIGGLLGGPVGAVLAANLMQKAAQQQALTRPQQQFMRNYQPGLAFPTTPSGPGANVGHSYSDLSSVGRSTYGESGQFGDAVDSGIGGLW